MFQYVIVTSFALESTTFPNLAGIARTQRGEHDPSEQYLPNMSEPMLWFGRSPPPRLEDLSRLIH